MTFNADNQEHGSGPTQRFSVRSFLLGSLVIFLYLSVLCGSPQVALQMIVVSVFCTLGIAALLWGTLAMLVGEVLLSLIPPLRTWPPAPSMPFSSVRRRAPVTTEARINSPSYMVFYSTTMLRGGVSEAQVRRDLERAGWGEHQISSVLEEARAGLSAMAHDSQGAGSDPDDG